MENSYSRNMIKFFKYDCTYTASKFVPNILTFLRTVARYRNNRI